MQKRWNKLPGALLGVLLTTVGTPPARAAEPAGKVDFARDIQPIFASDCIDCHGPKKQKGGLRLDARQAAMDGGTSGKSIISGDSKKSLLWLRTKGGGDEDQMPLKKDPLSPAQIELIARWIDQGAIWPEAAAGTVVVAAKHWSFEAPHRAVEPAVKSTAWCRNPIDRFVLARLEQEKIKPAPEAAKETLLRRVSLDLTGLPPTNKELDAFLADQSPDAYEKVVDRLLASPHYGERWGRHWLDQARYADSNGYSWDNPRSIWPYRDWVIGALNKDMPFDQFTIEQLAGDLLPSATEQQKVATGFHRNTQINEEGGIDPEQFRVEANVDRVGTTGTVFLGLTVACAQCHNHKFDPISQKDFYSLMAFFDGCDEPKLKLPKLIDEQYESSTKQRISKLEEEYAKYHADALEKIGDWEDELTADGIAKLPKAAQAALKVPVAKRTAKQAAAVVEGYVSLDAEYVRKKKELAGLKQELGGVTTLVMTERAQPRESFIFIKGDFTRHADPVTPNTPFILPPLKASATTRPTRLDLAKWIASGENPLTARVQVNRIWQHYFGKGLVDTDNDFGTQGSKPTHPELLDWLATEFVREHWSMKAMHRLMVTSATYRQASTARPELASSDPYNRLLARQTRVRLDAEIVRDVELTASGLLNDKLGGPPVFPPQPEGVTTVGQVKRVWTASKGPDRYRRGIYTWVWRLSPHPLLTSFDAADATLTCTRRTRSNTPLQALTLLNDAGFVEFARALAGRLLREGSADDATKIESAFRLCTARTPTASERQVLLRVLQKERAAFAATPDEVKALAADQIPAGVDAKEFAAWTVLSRVVLNLDETITRE